jgi:RNA polymerase sigma-70 factor (ECF subfamily)
MLKVKNGDIDKMGLLYERYNRQLFSFLFNMTRHRETSEDMVHNVFFRMLKYRKGFTGYGEFRTWMYHVARNTIHDHFRKNKRTPSHNSIQDFEGIISSEQFSDEQLEKQQELETLETAMKNLTDENRELLVLCRFQELKYHEIAHILNITEGAVKVRVHRALIQLKSNYLKNGN